MMLMKCLMIMVVMIGVMYGGMVNGHTATGTITNSSNLTLVLTQNDASDGKLTTSPSAKLGPFESTTFVLEDSFKYIKYHWSYSVMTEDQFCGQGVASPSASGYYRWHVGDSKCTADGGACNGNTMNVNAGSCAGVVGTSNPT